MEKKTAKLLALIEPSLMKAAKTAAKKADISLAEVVRQALKRYLRRK
jgi:predicted HicB family RNase H-like nuclease